MVRIDIAFIPTELDAKPLNGAIAVIVDVVRATTTTITALANGASHVLPVLEVEDAFQFKNNEKIPMLLGGERGGKRIEGFDLGNSPGEYLPEKVRNQGIIFSTTNGTRTLLKLREASQIFIGAFVNMSALCRKIEETSHKNTTQHCQDVHIMVACAGVANTFSLEDTVCAGMLVTRLRTLIPEISTTPSAMAAMILYQHYASDLLEMLRSSDGGSKLFPIGLQHDLIACAAVDQYDIVPQIVEGRIVL